ncbi:response regulator [Mucilaginibacter ginsenosidivorax]|uniref:Response regulator n=2 Tax=Mucilaginibacter ginsenosidivorax TaxID=862126 RepID=A0A5B8W8X2_9SPHI|nr:response regulator [Mucilaginibacter ginsenosidivorax]
MDNMDTIPKIMVIDDGELDSIIFKLVVKRVLHNSNIESCNSGLTAINRLKFLIEKQPNELPDYIFLDIMMPLMDGWEFLLEYKKLKIEPIYKSKIYMLSSSIDRDNILKSLSNPWVEAYLAKPIDVPTLKSIFQAN